MKHYTIIWDSIYYIHTIFTHPGFAFNPENSKCLLKASCPTSHLAGVYANELEKRLNLHTYKRYVCICVYMYVYIYIYNYIYIYLYVHIKKGTSHRGVIECYSLENSYVKFN